MDYNYRAVFTKELSYKYGGQVCKIKFESQPCTISEAQLFAQEMGGIVETYFPNIGVWAPLKDADVLKRYIK